VTKDRVDGTPTEVVELNGDEMSSFYAWEDFYKAVTTRERPANETPDEAIVNVIRVLEAVREASLGNGFAKVK
jgi:hypothetical protein